MALSGGEALVGPRVELLRCSDLQGVIVLSLDGDVLVGDDELGVPEPGDGVLWRALHGAGEEQGAADARFQVLRRQSHSQRVCKNTYALFIMGTCFCFVVYCFLFFLCSSHRRPPLGGLWMVDYVD